MACLTTSSEELRNEFLVCKACYRDFDDDDRCPHLLPCLHSLCHQCIIRGTKDRIVECRTCMTKHQALLLGNIDEEFPRDNTRRDLQDFLQVQTSADEIECVCGEDVPTHRCQQCAENLCVHCIGAHNLNILTRDHALLDISELSSVENLDGFCHRLMCPRHPGKPLELYCDEISCQKPICMVCALVTCNKHSVENVKQMCLQRRQMIREKIESLLTRKDKVHNVIRSVQEEINAVGLQEEEVTSEIDDIFDQLIELIDKRREDLKQQVMASTDHKIKLMEKQKTELESLTKQMEHSLSYSNQAVLHSNGPAFLQIEGMVNRRLDNLIDQDFDTMPRASASIGLSRDGLYDQVSKTLEQFSSIWSNLIYPPGIRIELDEEAKENEITSFQIRFRDHNGKAMEVEETGEEIKIFIKDPTGN